MYIHVYNVYIYIDFILKYKIGCSRVKMLLLEIGNQLGLILSIYIYIY